MSKIIIHSGGKYNIYETISDSPIFTEGCTLEQLENWTRANEGEKGIVELGIRIERANRKGTSSIIDEDLYETILCNRAGKDEKHMEFEEFVDQFLAPVI